VYHKIRGGEGMKKNLFWKILAIIFLLWMFLWLWNNLTYLCTPNAYIIVKVNKLTGKVYCVRYGQEWKRWDKPKGDIKK